MSDNPETATVNLPAVKAEIRPPLTAGAGIAAIVPRTYEEAYRMAQAICGSGLAPDSYDGDPKKVVIGLMTALELGVPPLQGLAGIAIINGRPAVWGDLAVALCQSKGAFANQRSFFEGTEGEDDYTAVYQVWRVGQKDMYEGRFSIKNAKTAHLWGNAKKAPWMLYPERMLFNRARAFALRNGFADHLKGLAIVEEVRDMAPAIERKADVAFLEDGTHEENNALISATPAVNSEVITANNAEFLE